MSKTRLSFLVCVFVLLAGSIQSVKAQTYAPGFISVVVATTTVTPAPYAAASKAVDNSGLSNDSPVGNRLAVMSNGSTFGWEYTRAQIASAWIQFDLGATHQLDEMWVRNWNQPSYTYIGMKDVIIQYKLNLADGWTTLGGAGKIWRFAQAPGTANAPTSNLADGSGSVKFGGVLARYVKISTAGD